VRIVRAAVGFFVACFAVGFVALGVAQCFGIVTRTVALQRELTVVRGEVADLRARRSEQERTIRRLRVPGGSIPEIHDRLRLVRPNEKLMYLRGAATPLPLP
jgi:hypothetical protein